MERSEFVIRIPFKDLFKFICMCDDSFDSPTFSCLIDTDFCVVVDDLGVKLDFKADNIHVILFTHQDIL